METKTNIEEKRQAAIDKNTADIPSKYRKIYNRAVKGGSSRAAITAFCLTCVNWKKSEVKNCTSLACPLWAFRSYQEISPSAKKRRFARAESTQIEQPIPG
jgi:hypothetical protein